MPLVLQGLTCTFRGGMRTGIVGRTGSGKSTLMQTLFHIIDPTAGQILIDGINISSIGLHDLRSRLSIIPQELRARCEALDKCQLREEVRKKEGKLDSTGLIEEYDSPTKLLENKSSAFARLVAEYSTRLLHLPPPHVHTGQEDSIATTRKTPCFTTLTATQEKLQAAATPLLRTELHPLP
ncbi:ABC transporter C family member 3 [Camellia lanceoleosa]|uniref:ABC transporter C family member 3 n=1 Tax=Camellia lanceoleosa TaxID=1840588 RepID=A0ACC0GZE7_9ERIC|nr:ABC transporter C family member 3 [Camellia lanceoleosa]